METHHDNSTHHAPRAALSGASSRAMGFRLLHALTLVATLCGLAGTAAAAEPGTNKPKTNWSCNRKDNRQHTGDVAIWWGHTPGDASWACNQWIAACKNNGGCNAAKANPRGAPSGQAQALLDAHNRVRREYGVGPLKWSDRLAASAQKWAQHLARTGSFEHSTSGENLAMMGGRQPAPAELVQMWINERSHFRRGTFPNVSTDGNWARVGHFTQVIWRGTTSVGCGIGKAGNKTILVCHYDPAGNMSGVQVP